MVDFPVQSLTTYRIQNLYHSDMTDLMQLNITGATVNEKQHASGLCINSGCGKFPFWLRLCVCFGLNFSSGVNWTSGKLLNLLDQFLINKTKQTQRQRRFQSCVVTQFTSCGSTLENGHN